MYLGIDVGGTKTVLAVLDEAGAITEQVTFPTAQSYDQFKQDLATNLGKLQVRQFQTAVAGLPGYLNRSSGTGHAFGNLPWQDVPIQQDIAELVKCQVIIENDSKTAALSEARAIKDTYRRSLYLTIGTGIGSGFVVDGSLEPNLLDSELGKMIFPYEGKLQSWEGIASGKAIFEKYQKKATEITDPADWEAIAHNLGLGVIAASAAYQPDVIIFGGGVGAHFEKFAQPLQAFLEENLHPVIHKPELVANVHAELSVIYGCYELAKHAHESPAS
jgi:predicted NBD/HSP70 family sugar kinase